MEITMSESINLKASSSRTGISRRNLLTGAAPAVGLACARAGLIFALASGLLTSARAADSNGPASGGRVPAAVSPETIQRIESLAPPRATAVPAKPRKVMIFCSVTGWRPPAISLVNKTFEILGKKSGAFEVAAVSEDASIFTPAKLA
jgi:hypothetical protein